MLSTLLWTKLRYAFCRSVVTATQPSALGRVYATTSMTRR